MPFRSKSQRRLFFAKERRGELPAGTARAWQAETSGKLPERVRPRRKRAQRRRDIEKLAFWSRVLAAMAPTG